MKDSGCSFEVKTAWIGDVDVLLGSKEIRQGFLVVPTPNQECCIRVDLAQRHMERRSPVPLVYVWCKIRNYPESRQAVQRLWSEEKQAVKATMTSRQSLTRKCLTIWQNSRLRTLVRFYEVITTFMYSKRWKCVEECEGRRLSSPLCTDCPLLFMEYSQNCCYSHWAGQWMVPTIICFPWPMFMEATAILGFPRTNSRVLLALWSLMTSLFTASMSFCFLLTWDYITAEVLQRWTTQRPRILGSQISIKWRGGSRKSQGPRPADKNCQSCMTLSSFHIQNREASTSHFSLAYRLGHVRRCVLTCFHHFPEFVFDTRFVLLSELKQQTMPGTVTWTKQQLNRTEFLSSEGNSWGQL